MLDVWGLLGYAGCACAVGIPAIGSSIGCGIAGAASHGVMAKVEEGHGKFIGMSAAPSSQTIYGIVLMFVLLGKVKTGAGLGVLAIGLFCGLAIMISAIFQGKVAATGILASSKKPEIFGKCFAAVGITESFALFAMVFGLIIAGGL
jgi:V/A-type H+/Na+-transporting ATPase subunit K